jgi:hypothetical protein
VLLLLVLNLVLAGLFSFKDSRQHRRQPTLAHLFNPDGSPVDNGKRLRGNLEWFDYDATKEVGEIAVAEVLDDFYDLAQKGFIYQPWTQFSEPSFAGKRVSVDLDGAGFPVRRTLNPAANASKRVINIFIFGGSTTFGYYVADEHTWPSYLAQVLNERAEREGLNIQVRVTNHGHATYFPSQETALCIDVFKSGQRPDLAIFMDGLNWGPGEDSPVYTAQLQHAFHSLQHVDAKMANDQLRAKLRTWIPMYRLATSIRQRFARQAEANGSTENRLDFPDKSATAQESSVVQRYVERFQQSSRISKKVCEEYGTPALFFIQPDPFYNYPLTLVKSSPEGTRWHPNQSERQIFHRQLSQDPQFISLDQAFNDFGVQQGKKAVLNGIHYNPAFNRFLAEIVAGRIDLKKLASASVRSTANATGTKGRS